MIRKILALVDADQLKRDALPGDSTPLDARDPEGPVVVIVLAANSWSNLARSAIKDVPRAARVIAFELTELVDAGRPSEVRHEIALTLKMPEAADRALVRLLREAPTEDGCGAFDDVILASGDSGLVRTLSGRVQGIRERKTWARNLPDGIGVHWWQTHPQKLIRRLAPAKPVVRVARAAGSPILVVDDEERARLASSANLQVGGTLGEIAKIVEQDPCRLSQVGVTRQSVAGVARMSIALTPSEPPPKIGPCRPLDGLEVSRLIGSERLSIPKRVSVAESSVGAGAVRLEWGEPRETLTVRTILPFELVRDVLHDAEASRCLASPRQLDDASVLHGARGAGWRAGRSCTVDVSPIRREHRAVRCKVQGDAPGDLPAWWVHREAADLRARAHSKIIFPRSFNLSSTVIHAITACAAIADDGSALLLEGADARCDVVLAERIRQRSLGVARRPDGTRCLVLNLAQAMAAGQTVCCEPIQRVDKGKSGAKIREALGLRLAKEEEAEWLRFLSEIRKWPVLVPVPGARRS